MNNHFVNSDLDGEERLKVYLAHHDVDAYYVNDK